MPFTKPGARMFGSKYSKSERAPATVRCPECGVGMFERTGKHGSFYGCVRFPLCVGTRPRGGEREDSYTALLKVAYAKAIRVLSGPAMLGLTGAAEWVGKELIAMDYVALVGQVQTIEFASNQMLETMIEKANALVQEKSGKDVDFLVLAHLERMEAIQSRLKYETDPAMLRQMPKPLITRRYDQGELDQLEAKVTDNWAEGGKYCPLCQSWCPLVGADKFDPLDEPDEEVWECGNHGCFKQGARGEGYVFERDQAQ